MKFENIKKRIASNIGYVDSSGAILTSKDVTESEIGNWVNDRYLDDLFPLLSTQYPEDYKQKGKLNFYKAAGEAAASTGTTLVATGSIFNNGMVGDSVYNSTDEEIAKITGFTSTTTVTLDTTINDTWDSDTIYILGHEFGLGGNATDARSMLRVSVKYSANDSYYRTCRKVDENTALKIGNETYSTVDPVWYPTTVDIDGVLTSAIGILPEPTRNIANGVLLQYTEIPSALVETTDEPRLPNGNHSILVTGGTADALRKLMRLDEADRFEQKYQAARMELITNYALTRAGGVPRVRPSRRLQNITDRDI
jgi:hypothetical protein